MNIPAGKRVLIIVDHLGYPSDPGVRNEASALIRAGYQVSIICQREPDQSWRGEMDGVCLYRYPELPWELSSFVAIFILSLFVWAWRGFDIIHAANPPDIAVFMALFYKLAGKQYLCLRPS